MKKIKEIKIVNPDASTELANIGADAQNVDYNNTTVKAELDKLNATDNSLINTQTNQGNALNSLQSQVSSLASGSPAGVYATVSALTSADPDHSKIYVVTADGHWYYYNNGWQDGGLYQVSGIADDSILFNHLNSEIRNAYDETYLSKKILSAEYDGFIRNTGIIASHPDFNYFKLSVREGEKYYYSTKTRGDACVYVITNAENNVISYLDSGASEEWYHGFVKIPKDGYYLYINTTSEYKNFGVIIKRNNIIMNKKQPLINNYSIGYVHSSSGNISFEHPPLSTKSITNIAPIKLHKGDIVNSSYAFTVAKYDENITFIDLTGPISWNYCIPETAYYRITLFNYNDVPLCNGYGIDSLLSDNLAKGLYINKEMNQPKYMHISFDDVYLCLNDITINADIYNSIFDNTFFADLKDLHEKYGAVFTLNTFNTYTNTDYDISNTTIKFKNEFNNNSDWLKFSFHAEDNITDYSANNDNILTSYNKFLTSVLNFAGYNAIDTFIRLGFFSGNSYNIDKLKSSTYRPQGLLTADDSRNSYYLNSTQASYIKNNIYAYDKNKDLYLIDSKTRLESLSSHTTLALTNYSKNYLCEIFTHEYAWNNDMKTLLSNLLVQANQLNYKFIYYPNILHLQNNLPE